MSAQKLNPESVCFTVAATAAPGVLPRVMQLFTKRGLIPDRFNAARNGAALTVDIQMHNMELELARYIGRCLNEFIEVDHVQVSGKRYADVA